MLFAIEVDEDWLASIDVLLETQLDESPSTPEEALEKAIFCQIQYQYQHTLSQKGNTMSQPEITFRHGSCCASVFENEYERGGRTFTMRSVVFQRRYIDRDGEWQTTSSLKVNDIPKAIITLQKAYEFLTSNAQCDEEDAAGS